MVNQIQNIPHWVKSYLDETGIREIESAIAAAEKQTSAEIVPMVVRRSSVVGHVPVILMIVFVGAIFTGAIYLPHHPSMFINGLILLGTLAVAWVVSLALTTVPFVQRLLTNDFDQTFQVQLRAEVEFFEAGLDHTAGRNGILLFVSLAEHKFVVLGDKAIDEKFPADGWEKIVALILSKLKKGQFAAGMCEAIHTCQEIVAPHFPIRPSDRNELSNRLIIKE